MKLFSIKILVLIALGHYCLVMDALGLDLFVSKETSEFFQRAKHAAAKGGDTRKFLYTYLSKDFVSSDTLQQRKLGRKGQIKYYLPNQNAPFTGSVINESFVPPLIVTSDHIETSLRRAALAILPSLIQLFEVKDGVKHGTELWYTREMLLKRKLNWFYGKEHGEDESWHRDTGVTMHKVNWVNGELNGLALSMHNDGGLKQAALFKEGIRHGYTFQFLRNGQCSSAQMYTNGFNDHNISWYENGMIKEIKLNTEFHSGEYLSSSFRFWDFGEIQEVTAYWNPYLQDPDDDDTWHRGNDMIKYQMSYDKDSGELSSLRSYMPDGSHCPWTRLTTEDAPMDSNVEKKTYPFGKFIIYDLVKAPSTFTVRDYKFLSFRSDFDAGPIIQARNELLTKVASRLHIAFNEMINERPNQVSPYKFIFWVDNPKSILQINPQRFRKDYVNIDTRYQVEDYFYNDTTDLTEIVNKTFKNAEIRHYEHGTEIYNAVREESLDVNYGVQYQFTARQEFHPSYCLLSLRIFLEIVDFDPESNTFRQVILSETDEVELKVSIEHFVDHLPIPTELLNFAPPPPSHFLDNYVAGWPY